MMISFLRREVGQIFSTRKMIASFLTILHLQPQFTDQIVLDMAENLQINVEEQQQQQLHQQQEQEEKLPSQDEQLQSPSEHHQVHHQKETLNKNDEKRSPTETSGSEQQNEALNKIENPSQNNLLIPNTPPTCMVFAFGSGKLGQLGLEVQEDQWLPSEVLALRNVPVVYIACAGTHSLACTGCFLLLIVHFHS